MSRVRPALAFTAVVWRTMVRDRTALFFMLVLPVAVMVIIGTTFGGQERAPVGVVRLDDGPLTGRVAGALARADGLRVKPFEDAEALRRAVRRQAVLAGVVLPSGMDARLRSGRPARIAFIGDQTSQAALSARVAVSGIVEAAGTPLTAAQLVTAELGGNFDRNLRLATAAGSGAAPAVRVEDIGEAQDGDLSKFSLTAPQNLVLFVFINAMAGAVLIVVARRDGILRRTLATRTPVGVLLLGLGLGWLALALVQSLLILAVGALIFDVRWGDPVAAGLLVLAFALVGCGAGLLVGAIGRDQDRVGAVAPVIGIVLGALGGCMVPLEIFPAAMESLAHAIPHYWAVRAWQQLIFEGAGVGAIVPSLLALIAFAAAFLGLATVLLRRQLVR